MDKKFLDALNSVNPDIIAIKGVNLIEDGILDSLAIMQCVAALEEAYAIDFDPEDILPENFATPETLFSLLQKYLKEQGHAG